MKRWPLVFCLASGHPGTAELKMTPQNVDRFGATTGKWSETTKGRIKNYMVGEEIESYTLVQFVCFSDITEHLKKAWVKRTGAAEMPFIAMCTSQ